MSDTLEMKFIFTLSQSGEKAIKGTSLYSAQSLLERTRATGDLVESTVLVVYTLAGRCGTDFNAIQCSADLRKLQSEMKKAYKETIKDLQGNYLKNESSCDKMNACIATNGDWHEWIISEHKVEL